MDRLWWGSINGLKILWIANCFGGGEWAEKVEQNGKKGSRLLLYLWRNKLKCQPGGWNIIFVLKLWDLLRIVSAGNFILHMGRWRADHYVYCGSCVLKVLRSVNGVQLHFWRGRRKSSFRHCPRLSWRFLKAFYGFGLWPFNDVSKVLWNETNSLYRSLICGWHIIEALGF